jgi:hypothetical protein
MTPIEPAEMTAVSAHARAATKTGVAHRSEIESVIATEAETVTETETETETKPETVAEIVTATATVIVTEIDAEVGSTVTIADTGSAINTGHAHPAATRVTGAAEVRALRLRNL